jgi:hypothetical protein
MRCISLPPSLSINCLSISPSPCVLQISKNFVHNAHDRAFLECLQSDIENAFFFVFRKALFKHVFFVMAINVFFCMGLVCHLKLLSSVTSITSLGV